MQYTIVKSAAAAELEESNIPPAVVVFFENGPEPGSGGGTDTCCERRTIASGRSHATVGKRQRKRQKSRQVTDLPRDQQIATAAVSPAASLFAVQQVSGPPLNRPRLPRPERT
jgi:hypothetical protein